MKIIKFKALRSSHGSGFRHIQVTGEGGEDLGSYHDVVHLQIGGALGSWVNIDCEKNGTFRIFVFPDPEGPELEPDQGIMAHVSSLIIKIKGVRIDPRDKEIK